MRAIANAEIPLKYHLPCGQQSISQDMDQPGL